MEVVPSLGKQRALALESPEVCFTDSAALGVVTVAPRGSSEREPPGSWRAGCCWSRNPLELPTAAAHRGSRAAGTPSPRGKPESGVLRVTPKALLGPRGDRGWRGGNLDLQAGTRPHPRGGLTHLCHPGPKRAAPVLGLHHPRCLQGARVDLAGGLAQRPRMLTTGKVSHPGTDLGARASPASVTGSRASAPGSRASAEPRQRPRLTTSRPRTVPRSEPYRRNRRPPALVATFPPMWQLPFAPRSSGMTKPRSSTYRLSSSRTQPAWQTRTPAKQPERPRELSSGPAGPRGGALQAKTPRRGVRPEPGRGGKGACPPSLPRRCLHEKRKNTVRPNGGKKPHIHHTPPHTYTLMQGSRKRRAATRLWPSTVGVILPPGTRDNSGGDLGWRCCWHRVGGGQGAARHRPVSRYPCQTARSTRMSCPRGTDSPLPGPELHEQGAP